MVSSIEKVTKGPGGQNEFRYRETDVNKVYFRGRVGKQNRNSIMNNWN